MIAQRCMYQAPSQNFGKSSFIHGSHNTNNLPLSWHIYTNDQWIDEWMNEWMSEYVSFRHSHAKCTILYNCCYNDDCTAYSNFTKGVIGITQFCFENAKTTIVERPQHHNTTNLLKLKNTFTHFRLPDGSLSRCILAKHLPQCAIKQNTV